MSKPLLLLCIKEWHEWFALDSSKLLSKTSNLLETKSCFLMFLTVFHCFSPFYAPKKIKLLPSLFTLTKEQSGVICSFHKQIALSLFCSHKTSNSLGKPKSEFPILDPHQQHCLKFKILIWIQNCLYNKIGVANNCKG